MAIDALLDTRSDSTQSNTLVGVFATMHDAREAIKNLHKGNFKQTWLGVTKPADRETGEPLVENPDSLTRFISADRMPLRKALLQHGVAEWQAEQIESDIAPGCSIVTVYGEDNPARANELLRANKGQTTDITDDLPSAVAIAGMTPRSGVDPKRDDPPNDDQAYDEFEFVETRPRFNF
jgi:hypothetical protein